MLHRAQKELLTRYGVLMSPSPFAKAKCLAQCADGASPHEAHRACELTPRSMQKTSCEKLLSLLRTPRLHFAAPAGAGLRRRRAMLDMHAVLTE